MTEEFIPTFRFFKTIYEPEYMYHAIFPTLKKNKQEKFKNQINKDSINRIEKYLTQPQNGEWIDLNFTELKYLNYNPINLAWLESHMEYAESLSKREIMTAASYSFKGDRIINFYKNSKFDFQKFKSIFKQDKFSGDFENYKYMLWYRNLFPFFPQFVDVLNQETNLSPNFDIKKKLTQGYSFTNYNLLLELGPLVSEDTWKKIFDLFLFDFRNIINNIPVIPSDLNAWRGMGSDLFYNYRNQNKTNIYRSTQFLSTTLDLRISFDFTGSDKITNKNGKELGCCLLCINIPAGSHVLLLMPFSKYLHEYEILLKDETPFVIEKNRYSTFFESEYAITNMKILKYIPQKQIVYDIDLEELEKYKEVFMFGNKQSKIFVTRDIKYLKQLITLKHF